MNLRKILLIGMVIITLIIGCLLWSWWLLPFSFAGFIYFRVGWQMIIWRRKMANRIFEDVIMSKDDEILFGMIVWFIDTDKIKYFKYAIIFPITFFTIIFLIEIGLKNNKTKWPLKFLISYRKKAPWYYKGFIPVFWLPLFIYGIIMFIISAISCVFSLVFITICELITPALKKLLFFSDIPNRPDRKEE